MQYRNHNELAHIMVTDHCLIFGALWMLAEVKFANWLRATAESVKALPKSSATSARTINTKQLTHLSLSRNQGS